MAWEKLTICVKARKNDGGYAIGTGFPVARGLILTARHVVRPNEATGEILVRWWHSKAEGFGPSAGQNKDGFLRAKIAWEEDFRHEGDDFSVALLRAEHPPELGFVQLSASGPIDGANCTCEAFPSGARIDGRTDRIRVRGVQNKLDAAGCFFQINLQNDPNDLVDWGGLSGAPVIDPERGHALGVYIIARGALSENKFAKARFGESILAAPGFAAQLGPDWRTYKPNAAWQAEYRRVLRRILAERVGALPTENLQALLKRCGLRDVNGGIADRMHIADLLITDCQASVDKIRAYQKSVEGRDPVVAELIGQVAWSVAVLDLDDDALCLVAYMAHKRDEPATLPLGGPASTLTLLELIAAAIDRGFPIFERRHSHGELPRGKSCVPFCVPEGGPEQDELSDFVRHLAAQLGISHHDAASLLGRVESFLSRADLRLVSDRRAHVTGELDDLTVRELQAVLRERKDDDDRSFYVPVVLPNDPAMADQMRECIFRLRQKYPEILALSLDPSIERAEAERKRLGRLISTVRLRDPE